MNIAVYKSHTNCSVYIESITKKNLESILSRKIYNFMTLEEISVGDYLAESKDNIVFCDKKKNVYGSSISRLEDAKNAKNLIIECDGPKNGAVYLQDVINNAWYFRVGMDVTNSALSVRCIQRIIVNHFNYNCQIFGLDEPTRLDYTITLQNVITGPRGRTLTGDEPDYTSSTHCNPGSEVYIWKKVVVLVSGDKSYNIEDTHDDDIEIEQPENDDPYRNVRDEFLRKLNAFISYLQTSLEQYPNLRRNIEPELIRLTRARDSIMESNDYIPASHADAFMDSTINIRSIIDRHASTP